MGDLAAAGGGPGEVGEVRGPVQILRQDPPGQDPLYDRHRGLRHRHGQGSAVPSTMRGSSEVLGGEPQE
eukprot:4906821-Alexandrium_andersonii.AAC.1